MAGTYCRFCGSRCFVGRVIPGGPQQGWVGHLATCARGKAYDREQTGGYDADNTINPVTPEGEAGERDRQMLALIGGIREARAEGRQAAARGRADEAAWWGAREQERQRELDALRD